jgi:hypothetical protein
MSTFRPPPCTVHSFYDLNESKTRYHTTLFWNITPCSSFMNQRFGGMYHFHRQDIKISRERNQRPITPSSSFMNQRFGGMYHFHLQDRKISRERNQRPSKCLEPDMFLRKQTTRRHIREVGKSRNYHCDSFTFYSTLHARPRISSLAAPLHEFGYTVTLGVVIKLAAPFQSASHGRTLMREYYFKDRLVDTYASAWIAHFESCYTSRDHVTQCLMLVCVLRYCTTF